MPIRVCHITSVHPPYDVRIFHKECCSLAKKYEVWLIAPNVEDSVKNGVNMAGLKIPKGRIQRLFHQREILKKALSIDAVSYHLHDPELLPIGLRLKRKGKIVIFDSHEDVPQQLLTKEWLPRPIAKIFSKLYACYEAYALKRFDAVISVTPVIVDRLQKVNSKTFQVTNFPVITTTQDNRKWEDSICFTGGVSAKYMHENIINALTGLNVKYRVAGLCDPISYMDTLKALPNWNKVSYDGVLPHSECASYIQASTAGLALLDYLPNVGYRKGSLGVLKIFEYMQAGIPVIATDFDIWKEIIEGNDCGVCIDPHDVNAIAKAINFFMENKEIARQKGDNGRQAVEKYYSWSTQEKILFDIYSSVVEKAIN